MIKVKAEANYGFAGTDMIFEEEFDDDVTDEEIEEAIEIWLWNRLIGHGRRWENERTREDFGRDKQYLQGCGK